MLSSSIFPEVSMLETKICRAWEAGMWEKRTWISKQLVHSHRRLNLTLPLNISYQLLHKTRNQLQVFRYVGSFDSLVNSLPHVWWCACASSCLNIHLSIQQRRKTICFSKSEEMHDTVIELFINRYEFGRAIWTHIHTFRTLPTLTLGRVQRWFS